MKNLTILLLALLFAFTGSAQNTFSDFLKSVESNNLQLKSYRELATSRKIEAKTGLTPENPEIEFEYMPGDVAGMGTMTTTKISQRIEFPTVYGQKNKLAKLEQNQSEHEFETARIETLAKASALYIQHISLAQKANLYEERQALAEKLLQAFGQKLDRGDASILEVNKLRLEFAQAKKARALILAELEGNEKQLTLINGGKPFVVTSNNFPVYPEISKDQLIEAYRQKDPELQLAGNLVEMARQEVRIEKSKSLPEISFSYGYEKTPDVKYAGPGAGLSIPLWKNHNKVKLAQARQQYAEAQFTAETQARENKLETKISQLQIIKVSLDEMRETLSNVNSVDLLSKALEAGEISLIVYIGEVQYFFQAREDLLDLEQEYYLLLADVQKIGL